MNNDLKDLQKLLDKRRRLANAASIISYDLETICPKKGMSYESDTLTMLSSEMFKISSSKEFKDLIVKLYKEKDSLEYLDRVYVEKEYKDYLKEKNITPELNLKATNIYNEAFVKWIDAKNKKDFSLFAPYLKKVVDVSKELMNTRENKLSNMYDNFIDDFEEGFTTKDLDKFFADLKAGILELLARIKTSKHVIRSDFLTRFVPIYKQEEFSNYLLETNGFDFSRGAITTTEHPFTDDIGKDDVRVTTHYFTNLFISNIFSVIHEGGHAIFAQQQTDELFKHNLDNKMSMGMHESVSRFYENIIGRSKEYIHLIYPKFHELFKEELGDVSENELYEGVNLVTPSLVRTEADEVTYCIHIIIRYEIEKELINNNLDVNKVPELWNKKYQEYLGVSPKDDKEGCLQDVHWCSGFGYFPSYAIGNAYNSMYFEKMNKEIDVKKIISEGKMNEIISWLKENTFKKSNILNDKEWLKDLTGESLSASSFIKYLDVKYSDIYKI
ncbi:MAG: carboxypeptidase M32 [Bacilli bacterium]